MTDTARVSGFVRSTRSRWFMLALIFAITAVNLADRATISITAPAMRGEFGFSPVALGYIFSAFGWAYVVAQIPSGVLLDRFGTRRIYALSIFFWSLFTLCMSGVGTFGAIADAVTLLLTLRVLIGLAEAPSFPANAKVVSEWFPPVERGTASAIFNSAQYLSPVLFMPFMAWLTTNYSWHWVYLVMGVLGIGMSILWLRFGRSPDESPYPNEAERAYIRGQIEEDPTTAASQSSGSTLTHIVALLRIRMFLGIYLGQFCLNALTYFFLTWFPVYLVEARHMTILKAGFVAVLPAICGFAGGVLGGVVSDYLIRRGWSLSAARKTPITVGLLLATVIILCNYVDNNVIVVVAMAISFFGKGFASLGWALVADTAPRKAAGVSGGLFNSFGNAGGIVTPIVIGYLVGQSGDFRNALVFVGCSAVAALFFFIVVAGRIRRQEI